VAPVGNLGVLFGTSDWNQVIDVDAPIRNGMIDSGDAAIFHRTDVVADAFQFLTSRLAQYARDESGVIL
jgi:hypothetical protein